MAINANKIDGLDVETGKKFSTFADGENGLYLYVYSKDKKWWRFRCRHEGKQVLVSLGTWPKVSLKEAREKAEKLYNLSKKGINPSAHIQAEKAAQDAAMSNSFEVVAREWWHKKKQGKAESHKKRIIVSLEQDVFPYIGKKPVNELKAKDFIQIAEKIETRGAIETAHRVIGRCGEVMLYAIATERAESTPIAAVKQSLQEVKSKHMAATIEPQKVGELLRMIDDYFGSAVVKAALKLAPLVFVRPGELRHAEWADFDFEKKQWSFIASKTKQPLIVPLSKQAIDILAELKPITGQGRYVFPSPASKDRPMSNNAILAAFRRMGITKDEHSGHGWRATARTLLDEVLKFSVPAIELQLAHAVKDMHGRAYNRTTLIDDRTKMMQAWADYLDELKK